MAGIDKSTARAIAVVALLFVAAWALRGYLPGIEPVADRGAATQQPRGAGRRRRPARRFGGDHRHRDHLAVAQSSGAAPGGGAVAREPGHHGPPDVALLADRPRSDHRVVGAGAGVDADGRGEPRRSATVGFSDRAGPGQRAAPHQSGPAATGFAGRAGYQHRRLPRPADVDPDGVDRRRHGHRLASAAARRDVVGCRRR